MDKDILMEKTTHPTVFRGDIEPLFALSNLIPSSGNNVCKGTKMEHMASTVLNE